MTKTLGALMVVLCLSWFGAGAANAFVSPSEAVVTVDGDGKKKHRKHKRHHKHHKKHGKKHGKKNKDNTK